MGRIVALGEAVADIYRSKDMSPVEMPLSARPGGAPANVAVAAAKLGSKAAFVGSVGEDLFGEFILRALAAEGVDVSGVVRQSPPTRTTLAFVEVSGDGDRSFTFYRSQPAADELLSPEDLSRMVLSEASFLTFGSIPLITETSRGAVWRAVEFAEEMGVILAFDVNLREHLWQSLDDARRAVDPLLVRAGLVKLSGDELLPLLGTRDPGEATETLLARAARLVFITLGEEGAFYATRGFSGRVPAFGVEAVDATGAGDAFLAAALSHLAGVGEPASWDETMVREAARRGAAAGALACTDFGAMSALPRREDLERLLANG